MQTLKEKDIIYFRDIREEVLGRLGNMIWTRALYKTGAVGSIQGPHLIDDLETYGWKKEGE